MRVCFRAVTVAFALALLFFARADAVIPFGFQVTVSPDPVIVSNAVTYSISITNISGATMDDVSLTNIFNELVQVTLTNSATTNWNVLYQDIGQMVSGQSTNILVQVTPTATGTLSNYVFVANTNWSATDFDDFTNIPVSVIGTNIVSQADLGVSFGNFSPIGYPSDIFVNDRVTYDVIVTNAGPGSATKVFLTNSLPSGIKLLSVSPKNLISVSNNSTVVLNLGTLTNGFSGDYQITFQPTNSGNYTFSAFFNSNNFDSNLTNNFASTNITVFDFLPGTSNLVVYTNSGQVYSIQSGRLEQLVTLSNAGPTDAQAARVMVSGLTNQLSNATGTNDGNPFVVYGAPLDAGQSVDLTLRYYPNTSPFTFTNGQLHAAEVTPPDFTVMIPTNGFASTNINFIFQTNLPPGYVLANNATLVVFTNGFFNNHLYTNHLFSVLYSDYDGTWRAAQPSFKVLANHLLWIDYGPPETLSNSPSREYMIYINP